jgi:hypothetical protein
MKCRATNGKPGTQRYRVLDEQGIVADDVPSLGLAEKIAEALTDRTPYQFRGSDGRMIDRESLIGERCKAISGHYEILTKEEVARLCGVKQRENDLAKALWAMKRAGESVLAKSLVNQLLG